MIVINAMKRKSGVCESETRDLTEIYLSEITLPTSPPRKRVSCEKQLHKSNLMKQTKTQPGLEGRGEYVTF